MTRFEMSCWASEVGTGIQSRNRPASLGRSFTRTVYLNSKTRDEPGFGASAGTVAATAAAATRAVANPESPVLHTRLILLLIPSEGRELFAAAPGKDVERGVGAGDDVERVGDFRKVGPAKHDVELVLAETRVDAVADATETHVRTVLQRRGKRHARRPAQRRGPRAFACPQRRFVQQHRGGRLGGNQHDVRPDRR